MERDLIIFKGRVQGVGFRYMAQRNAISLGLTGYAQNLYIGDVKVEVQGESENINKFIKSMYNCSHFIMIEDYSIKRIDTIPNEKNFSIKY